MKLHSIDAGNFKLDGGAMFGVVPKSIWQKFNPPDENNLCSWAMRCLLIEEDDRLILVDNGMGDKQDVKFFSHYFLHGGNLDASLAEKGFSPGDVTDVFLTHLHFDHCGGSVKKANDLLVPAFKNATYWSNKKHWNWAINPNSREKASFLKENILPLQESGRLKFIEVNDGIPFSENISVRFMYGHTEAMMLPQINYKGKTLVFMADLLPSIAHIPVAYVMAYDTRPLTTMTEKQSFLTEAELRNYVLFFEHDPVNECCTLQSTGKGIRGGDTFRLEDL